MHITCKQVYLIAVGLPSKQLQAQTVTLQLCLQLCGLTQHGISFLSACLPAFLPFSLSLLRKTIIYKIRVHYESDRQKFAGIQIFYPNHQKGILSTSFQIWSFHHSDFSPVPSGPAASLVTSLVNAKTEETWQAQFTLVGRVKMGFGKNSIPVSIYQNLHGSSVSSGYPELLPPQPPHWYSTKWLLTADMSSLSVLINQLCLQNIPTVSCFSSTFKPV